MARNPRRAGRARHAGHSTARHGLQNTPPGAQSTTGLGSADARRPKAPGVDKPDLGPSGLAGLS